MGMNYMNEQVCKYETPINPGKQEPLQRNTTLILGINNLSN